MMQYRDRSERPSIILWVRTLYKLEEDAFRKLFEPQDLFSWRLFTCGILIFHIALACEMRLAHLREGYVQRRETKKGNKGESREQPDG